MEARPSRLTAKTILVTGAGRGIGRAIANSLAAEGADLILSGRNLDRLHQTADAISEAGGRAHVFQADIGEEDQVLDLFRHIQGRFPRLDVLVNNAGIGEYGPLAEFPTDAFDRIMRVNLRGTFLCCREAMKLMLPQKAGTIINISSVVGFKGYPNQSAYAASKHAIMGLTKALAVEAQPHGIRVSAVLPGGVDTDLVAESRPDLDRACLIAPEDIAETVLFLLTLSDRAAVDQIFIRRANSTPFP
jgi:NAD(P)-dependent dehydrogenase (short-subunit alcohol dehydrogenase family)